MNIPVNIAQMIVNTLEKNVGYKINFMDEKGVIIASSDPSRIGKNHEGALIVIENNHPITIPENSSLKNSREGINLPVEFEEEVIGTVGITGKVEEVQGFGTIIKTMTELLIHNYFMSNLRQYGIEREQALVNHLLYHTDLPSTRTKEERVIEHFQTHGAQIIVWKNTKEFDNVIERTELYHRFKTMLTYYHHFVSILNDEILLIVDAEIPKLRISALNHSALLKDFTLGIGHPVTNIDMLDQSYKVATFIAQENNPSINSYVYLEDEYLLKTTDQTAIQLLLDKVMANLTSDEIETYQKFLTVYEKHNGGINKMAEELFIHKNTVQYRLDKIYEKTGYNPREPKDYYLLKLAFNSWIYWFEN